MQRSVRIEKDVGDPSTSDTDHSCAARARQHVLDLLAIAADPPSFPCFASHQDGQLRIFPKSGGYVFALYLLVSA